MNMLTRILNAVMVVVAFAALATEAHAQFPTCNGTEIIIRNPTNFDALVCIKQLDCYYVPAGTKLPVPVVPGTEVPGIYGAGNVTYTWEPNPFPPPALWIPSIQMLPSNRCFNVTYDEANCVIDLQLTFGPPCLNP